MAQFVVGCEGVRRLRGQHALSPIDRIPYVIPMSGLAWVVSLAHAMHLAIHLQNLIAIEICPAAPHGPRHRFAPPLPPHRARPGMTWAALAATDWRAWWDVPK